MRNSSRDSGGSPRFRIPLAIGVALLFTLFLSARGIAQLVTDYLWFDALGSAAVWRTMAGTQIVLAAMFTLVFFALLWANLYLADRLAPPLRLEGPEDDLIERYHQVIGPHAGKVRIGIAGFFAAFAGLQTSRQWEAWVLFRNGGDFGFEDPLFNKDAGFYVFRLPFWTYLIDWFFAALVFALILTTVAHYLNGGIRAVGTSRLGPGVKLHLSILLAVLALLRAGAYWFDRYELVTSSRGAYTGALATDVEIQLPALNLLALISLFGAGLILYNIRRKGFGLPLVTVGVWMVAHLVVGGIFPALYQRLQVEPQLSSQEAPFILRNIEATRFAYGLDDTALTRETVADYRSELTAEMVTEGSEVFDRVQLLDPALIDEAVTKDEAQRKEYDFADPLDVDRYMVDGELVPVVLSARGLNLSQADAGWENQHVAYTHGYAAAIALANVTANGQPDYVMKGIGPNLVVDDRLGLALDQPQLYYSEDLGGFAVVGANRDEIDYPGGAGSEASAIRYDGEGGVPMGSFIRRLAFSLRFQDLSTLISGELNDESRVIFNRDIVERARTLAPYLAFDSDPYPVVAEGRIQWVVDAYTTTDRFPYAQGNRVTSLSSGDDLNSSFNYIRNSVKVVVDAYDGDVSFYIVDPDDPLAAAYDKTFPDLFTPVDEAPQSIRAHFRYPTDLFKVQSEMFATYHVDDARQFLQDDLSWRVASEPLTSSEGSDSVSTVQGLMAPQYRLTTLPGSDEFEYVLQRAFVPSSGADSSSDRPELTAILTARSDGDAAGQLMLYELPINQVAAPALVDANIRKYQPVSEYVTPLDLQGSEVKWGAMQLVLLDNTVVYVRPLYVGGSGGSTSVPELDRVVAVSSDGNRIGMGRDLDEALAQVVTGQVVSLPDDSDEATTTTPPDVSDNLSDLSAAELLSAASELLAAADALQDTNPERAAELRLEAQAALDQMGRVLGIEPTSSVGESGET